MFNSSSSRARSDSSKGGVARFKKPYFKRARSCPLADYSSSDIDYKNKALLQKFVSEYGRMLPSRITSVSAKKQRMLRQAIKRARYMALLPYCNSQV